MFTDLLDYFENRINNETRSINIREYRLHRVKALLKKLGDPQDKVKAFHIAGSKGKGTTVKIIQECLTALGNKVGCFTSPHIFTYRERFTINGNICNENLYDLISGEFLSLIEDFVFEDNTTATTFELFTAFAFYFFFKTNCDYMIIEVGLGGRLDATNVIKDSIALITSLEKEHTDVLGDTIEQIAFEKASIAKSNLYVSILPEIAYPICNNICSNTYRLDEYLINFEYKIKGEYSSITIKFKDRTIKLKTKLIGKVMAQNIALALFVLIKNNLYKKGITEKAIENIALLGRFYKLRENPLTFIDCAHTVSSIDSVYSNIKEMFPNKKIISIFALVKGKDYKNICPIVETNSHKIILCKPSTYKESNLDELSKHFNTYDRYNEIKDAYAKALEYYDNNSIIICTGSFYLIGLLYRYLVEVDYES